MKINDVEYITPFNCFIYLNGQIFELDEEVARILIEEDFEIVTFGGKSDGRSD